MISVVVCTRDRANRLERTLRSLHDMTVPPTLEWEIVVVDNDSRDGTRDIVAAFARHAPIPVRYVVERRPGLSSARNAGIRAAHGDVLAFTDDDCLVDAQWVNRIETEFRADPSLAIVGGRVELHDPRDRPVSVRTQPERALVQSLHDIVAFMIGCNMSCRRRVFADIGDFDVRFGAGATIPSAEDWDFLYRAHKAGARIVFAPTVLVFHDHGRRTDAEVERLRRAYAIGRWAFYCKHTARFDRGVVRMAAQDLSFLGSQVLRHRRIGVMAPVALGLTYWLRALGRRRRGIP
jgi:glycosyltransferase involved in cell wall biosynthesis